ncbi:MAG: AraC family transcriptional regulator [Chitinophagaceae bacterium]
MSTLHIRNMVCPRCIAAVKQQLQQTGLEPLQVKLGEVVLAASPSKEQEEQLRKGLSELGFELLDDVRTQQIQKIKDIIIQHVHYSEDSKFPFADILSRSLHRDYSYLSKLFSETEGITIEQYVILQKTERVKELLIYNEKSLSEIAFQLGYSSVAHLSAQFKKVTGLTPSAFKAQGSNLRKPLDGV